VSAVLPTLAGAVGYVVGVGLGGALAARLQGRSALAGRRCPACRASLSPVAALPFLSWFGVRPRCPRCGAGTPWREAALETGVVLIGLIAILTLPMPWAVVAGAAGFLAFFFAVRRWG
jgi:prepilin signal peptidase PulO-like enzyme (type II secretory pathway)